ncbi:MalY/PatB family protein [Nostoc sp.]|uniref:MalY/PatB family protein n=1 Tax=Nostoc sp. TaxID=1180 RepID=UPI002FF4B036
MKYNFDKVILRSNTRSLKHDTQEQYVKPKDTIPMWVADMDFEAPPEVLEAIRQRAEYGIFGYSVRTDDYYDAVINWMRRRFAWEVKQSWITFTPGVVPALNFAIKAFTHPGDKVIIQPPVYYPFMNAVINNGRRLVTNQLIQHENGTYTIDFDDLERSIDDQTRLIIFCSPHNPVGRVWRLEELNRFAKICLKHDLVVVSDEIHADLIMPGYKHTVLETLSDEIASRVVTCTAPNKTFNLAGLGVANIIISNASLRNSFNTELSKAGLMMTNTFGIEATIAAYRYGEPWLEALNSYLHQNFKFLASFVRDHLPQVKAIPLEGTYLVWLDFRGMGRSDDEINETLLNQAKVWLSDGSIFGKGGEGFQRINIATPRDVLERGLKQIAKAFADN